MQRAERRPGRLTENEQGRLVAHFAPPCRDLIRPRSRTAIALLLKDVDSLPVGSEHELDVPDAVFGHRQDRDVRSKNLQQLMP